MIAVDTNVLVRIITRDEPKQAAAALALFQSETVWIAKTVLLETAWVLRQYGFDQAAIREALARFLSLDQVRVEDEPSVSAALDLAAHGVRLDDALHMSGTPAGARFVSFDRLLIRRARRAGLRNVASPGE